MRVTKQHGILTMIASAAGMLLSVLLSSGWNSDWHLVANFLHVMHVQFFFFGGEYGVEPIVDIPTKYAVSFFVVVFAIGLAMQVLYGKEASSEGKVSDEPI